MEQQLWGVYTLQEAFQAVMRDDPTTLRRGGALRGGGDDDLGRSHRVGATVAVGRMHHAS